MVTTLERTATSAALKTLQHYYTDRTAAFSEASKRGERVVGRVGNTAPAELILAAGFTPILIAADMDRPTPVADKYIDPIVPLETRALFEAAVAGEMEALDLLVLTRPYDKLFYYLKEIYRLGRAPKLPPLHIYDLLQSQRDSVKAYNWGRTQALVERLERAAGKPITEDALRQAIAATNHIRGLQRRVQTLRDEGRIPAVEALQAIGAGYFMSPAAYGEALSAYLADAGARPASAKGPRLLVITSDPLQHLSLHQAVDDAGALVVAEDDWWGSRAAGADIEAGDEPLKAIFEKYWLDTQTSQVHPPAAREAWFLEQAKRPDIDGIVFYLPPSDNKLGWDYPRLLEELKPTGKPTHLIRQEAASADGRAVIIDKLPAFLAGLGRGA